MHSGVRSKRMNISKRQHFFRNVRRWLLLLTGILAVNGLRAEEFQPNRFLLVFETSPTVKKSLPDIQQTLIQLFSGNLQNEMRDNDDLAVWTVGEELHTGTFPLASWSPEDAVVYSDQLKEFLGHQRYTRRASLAALQPLLNRVAKNSERLTVLIFCDSQSHLLGTPYDAGVNGIITNTAAKTKSSLFVLVLRSYRGAYLGCSVNRSLPLNFPKFPAPPAAPKPEPPPVAVKPAPMVPPPVVAPVPALIIVGTNASTNLEALVKPESVPAPPPPIVNPPAPHPLPPAVVAPAPAPVITAAPPANPPPVISTSPPVVTKPPPPLPVPQKTSAPEPVVTAPIIVTNPPPATESNTAAVTDNASPDAANRWPVIIAGGSLAVAAGLVGWLVVRSRRPRGSLITTSMQDDPNLPRRK
jgi:hypothetical protein